MKIKFFAAPGQIVGVYTSLMIASNYDGFRKSVEQTGISFNSTMEREVLLIMNNKDIDQKKRDYFFKGSLSVMDFLVNSVDVWSSDTIEDHLRVLKETSSHRIRDRMRNLIGDAEENPSGNTFSLLKNAQLSYEDKWKLLSLLEEPTEHISEFIAFIESYLPHYRQSVERTKEELQVFNGFIEEQLSSLGHEFAQKLMRNTVALDVYDEVLISTSPFGLFFLDTLSDSRRCYLTLGLNYAELLNKITLQDDVDNHIRIYKSLADKTRFDVIEFLAGEKRFGKEIADKLGITPPSVSHHLHTLVMANLINAERQDQKVFYKLDKAVLRRSLDFLYEALGL